MHFIVFSNMPHFKYIIANISYNRITICMFTNINNSTIYKYFYTQLHTDKTFQYFNLCFHKPDLLFPLIFLLNPQTNY